MFGHFRGNLTEANNSSFCMSSVSAGARLELDRFARNRGKSHLIPIWQIFFEHLLKPWSGSSVGLCAPHKRADTPFRSPRDAPFCAQQRLVPAMLRLSPELAPSTGDGRSQKLQELPLQSLRVLLCCHFFPAAVPAVSEDARLPSCPAAAFLGPLRQP